MLQLYQRNIKLVFVYNKHFDDHFDESTDLKELTIKLNQRSTLSMKCVQLLKFNETLIAYDARYCWCKLPSITYWKWQWSEKRRTFSKSSPTKKGIPLDLQRKFRNPCQCHNRSPLCDKRCASCVEKRDGGVQNTCKFCKQFLLRTCNYNMWKLF